MLLHIKPNEKANKSSSIGILKIKIPDIADKFQICSTPLLYKKLKTKKPTKYKIKKRNPPVKILFFKSGRHKIAASPPVKSAMIPEYIGFKFVNKYNNKKMIIGEKRASIWNLCLLPYISCLLIFLCLVLKNNSYRTIATPPIEKVNIRLSMSKPVVDARLNSDGGFQYSGTNKGSVKPRGIAMKLPKNISFLKDLLNKKIKAQATSKTNDDAIHGFIFLSYLFKNLLCSQANTHAPA